MKLVTKDPAPRKRRAVIIFDRTIDYSAVLAGVILVFIILSVTAEVVTRAWLNRPINWVLQFSEIGLLYITFLGAAWVLKKEGHVKVDMVLSRLKPHHQALVNAVTSLIAAIFLLIITWYGAAVTWEQFQRGTYRTVVMHMPSWPALLIIPVGSFLFAIQFLRRAYGYLKSSRTSLEKEQSSP